MYDQLNYICIKIFSSKEIIQWKKGEATNEEKMLVGTLIMSSPLKLKLLIRVTYLNTRPLSLLAIHGDFILYMFPHHDVQYFRHYENWHPHPYLKES